MTASRLTTLLNFLNEDPADAFTHYAIALEYVNMGNIRDAVAKFEEVITLDPSYVPAYHQLGLLFIREHRKIDAKAILERGIEAATKAGDAHAQMEMQEAVDDNNL
jgi:Tfp pilus assembly protein PilF